MPIVNGFDVLKLIRATKELKHLPVVIFTVNYPDLGQSLIADHGGQVEMPANLEDLTLKQVNH